MNETKTPFIRQLAGRPVRVTIPTKIAFDLEAMHKATISVLGRLGCPTCHSGFDLRWELEDRFHIDENFRLREVLGERLG